MIAECTVPVRIKCITCGQIYKVEVRPTAYKRWVEGALIQAAMPELSVGDRELLISHVCSDCFDSMFSEDE